MFHYYFHSKLIDNDAPEFPRDWQQTNAAKLVLGCRVNIGSHPQVGIVSCFPLNKLQYTLEANAKPPKFTIEKLLRKVWATKDAGKGGEHQITTHYQEPVSSKGEVHVTERAIVQFTLRAYEGIFKKRLDTHHVLESELNNSTEICNRSVWKVMMEDSMVRLAETLITQTVIAHPQMYTTRGLHRLPPHVGLFVCKLQSTSQNLLTPSEWFIRSGRLPRDQIDPDDSLAYPEAIDVLLKYMRGSQVRRMSTDVQDGGPWEYQTSLEWGPSLEVPARREAAEGYVNWVMSKPDDLPLKYQAQRRIQNLGETETTLKEAYNAVPDAERKAR